MPEIAPFVIIESPFAGDIERNLRYVRACMRDCVFRSEAPFASHALYTQEGVLRDEVPEERELGMGLGWHVMKRADRVAVYTDLGWSSGMIRGVNAARDAGIEIVLRRLGGEWSTFEPGVDYAAVGGPPNDWHNLRIIDRSDPDLHKKQGGMYFEIDTKQGYAVKNILVDSRVHVEVIKEPGRFCFETYKD